MQVALNPSHALWHSFGFNNRFFPEGWQSNGFAVLQLKDMSLAGVLFALALALPFIKSERERNTPGVNK